MIVSVIKGWDTASVHYLTWLRRKSHKPLLTSYVMDYTNHYEEAKAGDLKKLSETKPWRMTTGHWMKPFHDLFPRKIQYIPAPIESNILLAQNGEPQPTAFFSAHSVFVDSQWLRDVPYDPKMYFDGEEDSLALRSYTHGYDLYYPTTHIVFHLYHRAKSKKHWDDHPALFTDLTHKTIARLNELIESEGGPDGSRHMGKYGLGRERTITQYQDWSGVDYTRMWLKTGSRYGEITGNNLPHFTPRLWIFNEGHFQMESIDADGEWWQEWKFVGGKAKREAKWVIMTRDTAPPVPNVLMYDKSREMEMNLTPEGCFYRMRIVKDNETTTTGEWTMMSHGFWA